MQKILTIFYLCLIFQPIFASDFPNPQVTTPLFPQISLTRPDGESPTTNHYYAYINIQPAISSQSTSQDPYCKILKHPCVCVSTFLMTTFAIGALIKYSCY